MPTIAENNKRIAKNTVYLYIRMLLTMAVSLYTSRVVLNALGVDDYGIFNVVGGLVSMFSLLSGTMYVSISRFLTFELGKGNYSKLSTVFSTSINIQILFSLVTVILAETLGLWFMNCKMNIPLERMYAANWAYQCALISFVIGLISVPYHSIIIAHERMSVYAIFSIIEVLLKLLMVLLLLILPWDKLIFYALLLVILSVIMRIVYVIYCTKNFSESKYHLVFDKSILKEMGKFAGWNYLGSVAAILHTQGLNILMNMFFGVTVNAARGIATQVESAVVMLVNNFTVAINPQITKSYATGDKTYMYSLICKGAKYSYFLMLLASIPIIAEAPMILHLWLGNVPDYTVVFLRLTLIVVLLDTLSDILTMAMQATTNIKLYHIVVSAITLLVLPICYLCYRLGMPVFVGYIICAIIMVVKLLAKVPLLHYMVGLPMATFVNQVIIRALLVTITAIIVPFLIIQYLEPTVSRLVISVLISVLWSFICMSIIGMTRDERYFLMSKAKHTAYKYMIRECHDNKKDQSGA